MRKILFGFGDVTDPDERTLYLLKQYVEEFIFDLIVRSYNRALKGGYSKLRLADIMQEIKEDEKMFLRAPKLLIVLDVAREAKKCIKSNSANKDLAQLADEEQQQQQQKLGAKPIKKKE